MITLFVNFLDFVKMSVDVTTGTIPLTGFNIIIIINIWYIVHNIGVLNLPLFPTDVYVRGVFVNVKSEKSGPVDSVRRVFFTI